MNTNHPRRVGNIWVFPDGKTLPVVSGGDHTAAPTLVDALRDQRAELLNQIDAILDTAREDNNRALTAQERTDHDALVAQIDGAGGLAEQIRNAEAAAADADRYSARDARRANARPVPNINVRGGSSLGADVSRDLNDILWATDEAVRAGTYDKTGTFRPHSTAFNAVEQVIVRNDMGDEGHAAPRITEYRPEDRATIRAFQKTVADMVIFGLLVDKDAKSSKQGFDVARKHRAFKDRWNRILNAMDVDTSGEGAEWVPTGIGASVHEKVRAAGKVAPLFSRIDLPTNPWKWPLEGADTTAYRVAEPTSDSATKVAASTPGTAAATFDAEIFGARSLFSRSLDADSAVAILPYATRKLVLAFANGEEMAILDGDSDGTHMDADVQALGATDIRTSWDGLRKRALANTSQATTATSTANLALIRKAMVRWGVNPADLAFIVGLSAMYSIITDANVLTVDKMGPNATILNGQIGSIYGVPIVVSEFVRENLNASGIQDGITTTKTYNLCVNRNEWVIGQRMALDVEADDSIYRETFQRVLVGFQREDFQNVGESSGDDTSIGYNVTP